MGKKLLVTTIIFGICSLIFGDTSPSLKFNPDGTFKIVQLTDIHLRGDGAGASQNAANEANEISSILEVEKPDLIVITGDVLLPYPDQAQGGQGTATSSDAIEQWIRTALSPIVNYCNANPNTKWAFTMGNHDYEKNCTDLNIMSFLTGGDPAIAPGNITASDNDFTFWDNLENGAGGQSYTKKGLNYALRIAPSDNPDVTASAVWMIDSHGVSGNSGVQTGLWIQAETVDWFTKTDSGFTAANNQAPIPSIMFTHIPPGMMTHVPFTIGSKHETICSASDNDSNPLNQALLNSGSVLGVFCGHDHSNDFAGIYKANPQGKNAYETSYVVGYGLKTVNNNSSSSCPKGPGARVFVLYENEFKFDTYVNLSNSDNSIDSKFTFDNLGKVYNPPPPPIVINGWSFVVEDTINNDSAIGSAFNSDGSKGYIVTSGKTLRYYENGAYMAQVQTFGDAPTGVACSADGSKVWVVTKGKLLDQISYASSSIEWPYVRLDTYGSVPLAVTLSADASSGFVTSGQGGGLCYYSKGAYKNHIGTSALGSSTGISCTADGSKIWLTGNSLTEGILNGSSWSFNNIDSVPSKAVALSADGSKGFVLTNDNSIRYFENSKFVSEFKPAQADNLSAISCDADGNTIWIVANNKLVKGVNTK